MRNQVVRIRGFGGPEQLEVVDEPLPLPGRGEVLIHVLASSVEYTDVVIRRHQYAQTMLRKAPFVMGYDVVGQIVELGEGVTGWNIGDVVADLTVTGSNASYRLLRARDLTQVPAGVDPAEAAAVILSWTTAYQLLHRSAHVQPGERVLVQGAAGAVGQALLVLGHMADLDLWGTARGEQAALVRALGGSPIDYQHDDFTQVLEEGFDIVFDGIGEDKYRRSLSALREDGLLCAFGYTGHVREGHTMAGTLAWIARSYLSLQLRGLYQGGKRARIYSINLMRALHPGWFHEDLETLFAMLAAGTIHPRVAARISFDDMIDAHRRVEAGGLDGKLVLVPDQPTVLH
jgi:NADPH:quinone reductase-like Zn-dependent oxidoreductase